MNLKQKVLNVLEYSPETSNSDIELTKKIWKKFHLDKLIYSQEARDYCLPLGNLSDIPTQDDIKRVRAHIQNNEHKFLPTDQKVLEARKILEKQWYIESLNVFKNT